jgi:hypothetical protein
LFDDDDDGGAPSRWEYDTDQAYQAAKKTFCEGSTAEEYK